MANSPSLDSSLLWILGLTFSVAAPASPIPPITQPAWGEQYVGTVRCLRLSGPASSSCLLLPARQHALSRGFVAFRCSFYTALWRAWEEGRDRKGGGRWGRREETGPVKKGSLPRIYYEFFWETVGWAGKWVIATPDEELFCVPDVFYPRQGFSFFNYQANYFSYIYYISCER